MRRLSGLFLIALIRIAMAVPAAAQTEPPASVDEPYLPWRAQLEADGPPRPPEPKRPWYGWQTLAIDVASVGSVVLAGFVDEPALAWTGLGVWLIGAPIAHVANDNAESAAISFGLRLGTLALTGGGLLLVAQSAFDDSSAGSGTGFGAVLFIIGLAGMIGAVAVDPSLLAFGKPVRPKTRGFVIVPWIEPEQGRAGVRFALATP
jgi:hypothetical protein